MKASVLDIAIFPVIIGVIFIGAVFGLILLSAFNSSDMISVSFPNLATIFDYGIPLVAVGLLLGSVIASYFIKVHPIFVVMSIIILVLVLIAQPAISNVFMGFATDSEIVTYSNQMPLTVQLLGNLPVILMIFGVIIIIALYAKSDSGGV